MMSNPTEYRYTQSHEWLRQEADGSFTVGITAHAQDALGELVYVELPDVGRTLEKGEACCVVESTKAASDVYAPLSGEVVGVNDTLAGSPQTVNESPFEQGWLLRLKPSDPSQLDGLMTMQQYEQTVGQD